MGNVPHGTGEIHSPKRKTPTQGTGSGGLSVDVDIRLKGAGLVITKSQIAAAIAALAAFIGWVWTR